MSSKLLYVAIDQGVQPRFFFFFFSSETATATSPTDLLVVKKDDLVDILHQWPEVMAELLDEAERHFLEVKVRE